MKSHWKRFGTTHAQTACLTFFGLAMTLGAPLAEGTCYLSPCQSENPCCVGQGQAPCACCTGLNQNGCNCSVQCYGGLCPQQCLTQCGSSGVGTCGQQVQWYNALTVCDGPGCPNGCMMIEGPYLCFNEWQCLPQDQMYSDSPNPSQCTCSCATDGSDDNCVICQSPWGGPPLIVSISVGSCLPCPSS